MFRGRGSLTSVCDRRREPAGRGAASARLDVRRRSAGKEDIGVSTISGLEIELTDSAEQAAGSLSDSTVDELFTLTSLSAVRGWVLPAAGCGAAGECPARVFRRSTLLGRAHVSPGRLRGRLGCSLQSN